MDLGECLLAGSGFAFVSVSNIGLDDWCTTDEIGHIRPRDNERDCWHDHSKADHITCCVISCMTRFGILCLRRRFLCLCMLALLFRDLQQCKRYLGFLIVLLWHALATTEHGQEDRSVGAPATCTEDATVDTKQI